MIGDISVFSGGCECLPPNVMWCLGQTLLIADYPALFAVIGTTYGGDGVTNFMLPSAGWIVSACTGNIIQVVL